ncbi:DNA-formamidopyrimidine glycosylase [Gorillibacterium massiliense]|uniref:DNA-formamidopyrimidine glycosylase n=1 Tax=Gorillibacterium massiliense TaxID=1280390 RepID=UPI0004AE8636|nr:DNA-formamidopyrimidine glycosylase [Gorillibacterium massiliense]
MPELPEVETVVRTLNSLVAGKRIDRVSVLLERIIQQPKEIEVFQDALQGQTIHRLERRGKFIRFLLDDLVLVSHLRMEGRYGVYAADEPVEKHTHVIFHFSDGTELRYKDVRQFGTMHIFRAGDELTAPPLHKLGLEPLAPEFSIKALQAAIGGKPTKLKPLLLNQEAVAGLGNIYVDEALFRAGLHPERPAASLSPAEMKKLHGAIVSVLQEAVDAGGSSIKSYVNGQGEMGMFQQQLHVYGRTGEPCSRCGTAIVKMKLGGRGTHYCPKCQKIRKAQ